MTTYIEQLLSIANNMSDLRIKTTNSNNGYAYLSCVIVDKKKSYCILQSWNKPLRS